MKRKSAGIAATLIIAGILALYWGAVFLATFFIGEIFVVGIAALIFIPLIGCLIYTAAKRIREIKEEDEDDYRKY